MERKNPEMTEVRRIGIWVVRKRTSFAVAKVKEGDVGGTVNSSPRIKSETPTAPITCGHNLAGICLRSSNVPTTPVRTVLGKYSTYIPNKH